jgi:VanZ family protein
VAIGSLSNMSPESKVGAAPWRRLIIRWIATTTWAGLIFYLSTQKFGSSFSEGLLKEALGSVHWHVSAYTFEILHLLIRKLAHLTEYGILGLLLYSSLGWEPQISWNFRRMVLTLVIVAAYSLTDEFHQLFVPGRGASLVDCGIDIAGGGVGMLFLFTQTHLPTPRLDACRQGDE